MLMIDVNFLLFLQIRCMKCKEKSERQERMMDLTVEIEGDIETLEEALKRFTGTEILDGENKYRCSRLALVTYLPCFKTFTIITRSVKPAFLF